MKQHLITAGIALAVVYLYHNGTLNALPVLDFKGPKK